MFGALQKIFKDVSIFLLTEIIKLCTILSIIYGIGTLIHRIMNAYNEEGASTAEQLSASLIENGSFSEYPFVVELLINDSTDSLKACNNKRQLVDCRSK